MKTITLFRVATILLSAFAAGCSSTLQSPDLARLYAPVAAQRKANPLIVIPGIMGSRLYRADADARDEVWPGSLWNFVSGHDLSMLALPVPGSAGIAGAPHVTALNTGGIFHEIAGRDFYGQIMRTLTDAGGYDCAPREAVTATSDCILFAWDWRKGMVAAAGELDALVEQIRRLRNDPGLKVDIVAHSAGGLLTRYFVRYGGVDVLDHDAAPITYAGGRKVRQAILIGTPNYGSVTALQKAITGIDVGMATIRPETIATMPGMFQLLPHPDRTWMIDIRGQRIDLDLFNTETWRENGWSIWDPAVRRRIRSGFSDQAAADAYLLAFEKHFARELARTARFHRALSRRMPGSPTQYIVFGSACVETSARCLLEEVDGQVHIRLNPGDIRNPVPGVPYAALMLEPGDGSVTKASLLARDSLDPQATRGDFPIAWSMFICEHHQNLPANPTFRDNLLNILLYGVQQATGTSRQP